MLDEGPMLIADIPVPYGLLRIGQATEVVFEDVASPDGSWRIYRWQVIAERRSSSPLFSRPPRGEDRSGWLNRSTCCLGEFSV